MALIATLFGLVAAVSWGIADFLAAKAAKKFGGMATSVLVTMVGTIAFIVIYALFFREHTNFVGKGILYALASGAVYTFANISFYKGLEYGPVNLVSPIGSMYAVVTAIVLVVLFHESLSLRQVLGVVAVMVGVGMALGLFEGVKRKSHERRGPFLAVVAALCWGLAWVFIAQAVKYIGWQFTAAIELVSSSLLFVVLIPWLRTFEKGLSLNLIPGSRSRLMITAALVMTLGFLSLSIGLDHYGSMASTIVVVSACYPIITIYLALHNLHEKFQPIPLTGAMLGIGGVILLSLG